MCTEVHIVPAFPQDHLANVLASHLPKRLGKAGDGLGCGTSIYTRYCHVRSCNLVGLRIMTLHSCNQAGKVPLMIIKIAHIAEHHHPQETKCVYATRKAA
jgi:hypothetical protein